MTSQNMHQSSRHEPGSAKGDERLVPRLRMHMPRCIGAWKIQEINIMTS